MTKPGQYNYRLPSVVPVITDSLDVSLHDPALREEVELTAHLIVAANASDHALGQREIDEILGLV